MADHVEWQSQKTLTCFHNVLLGLLNKSVSEKRSPHTMYPDTIITNLYEDTVYPDTLYPDAGHYGMYADTL